jgi:hypothetical protein
MEERRLVPGTVVFVVLNFMCYIIKHNTGKKVLSHTSHVSSRPRTRILAIAHGRRGTHSQGLHYPLDLTFKGRCS